MRRSPVLKSSKDISAAFVIAVFTLAAILIARDEKAYAGGIYYVYHPGYTFRVGFDCDPNYGCVPGSFSADGHASIYDYCAGYCPVEYMEETGSYVDEGPNLSYGPLHDAGISASTYDYTWWYNGSYNYLYESYPWVNVICGNGDETPNDIYQCAGSYPAEEPSGYYWVVETTMGYSCSDCIPQNPPSNSFDWYAYP